LVHKDGVLQDRRQLPCVRQKVRMVICLGDRVEIVTIEGRHPPMGTAFFLYNLLTLRETVDICPYFWIIYASCVVRCQNRMADPGRQLTSVRIFLKISKSRSCSIVSKHACTSTFTKYNFGLWSSSETKEKG
jgi:hypothetical protein